MQLNLLKGDSVNEILYEVKLSIRVIVVMSCILHNYNVKGHIGRNR